LKVGDYGVSSAREILSAVELYLQGLQIPSVTSLLPLRHPVIEQDEEGDSQPSHEKPNDIDAVPPIGKGAPEPQKVAD
jgi:hypothetical protein